MEVSISVVRGKDGKHYASLFLIGELGKPRQEEVFSVQGVEAIALMKKAKAMAQARGIEHVIGID